MPAYLLYALYAYAGGHALHDTYRITRWTVRKFTGNKELAADVAGAVVEGVATGVLTGAAEAAFPNEA